jgi:hypothetical protein
VRVAEHVVMGRVAGALRVRPLVLRGGVVEVRIPDAGDERSPPDDAAAKVGT